MSRGARRAAIIDRLMAVGYDWEAYDVRAIADECAVRGADPRDLPDLELLDIAARHWRDLRADDVACPSWCEDDHGHTYRACDAEGLQRVHKAMLASSAELNVSILLTCVEEREPGGRVRVDPPDTCVCADGNYTGAGLRQVAALLVDAADAADQAVGASPQWTEDQL